MKRRLSTFAKTANKKSSISNEAGEDKMDYEIKLTASALEARAMQDHLVVEEERDSIIADLMDELLINTLEDCYKIYMHRQRIAFTVHCACLALMDVIDFFMPSSDPGEPCGADGRPQWSGDRLPAPLNGDVWAGWPVLAGFGRPIKMSSSRYYKSLPLKDKSGHKTVKKSTKPSKELPEVASQRHVTISDRVGTEPEISLIKEIEQARPVEQKKKPIPKDNINPESEYRTNGSNVKAGKMPMQRDQREKSMTGTELQKFGTGRVNASGTVQVDNEHNEGSINSVILEPVPVSKLQEERIEMKYLVLPSDQKTPSKGKGKNALIKKTGFVRKDKKGKPDIINLR